MARSVANIQKSHEDFEEKEALSHYNGVNGSVSPNLRGSMLSSNQHFSQMQPARNASHQTLDIQSRMNLPTDNSYERD